MTAYYVKHNMQLLFWTWRGTKHSWRDSDTISSWIGTLLQRIQVQKRKYGIVREGLERKCSERGADWIIPASVVSHDRFFSDIKKARYTIFTPA